MRRNLDIGTLRSFATVLEAGGVTRAANRLNLTQSAVSMQIKRLEESLDTRLLDRSGRGVTPTPEGEQLLAYARRLIAANDEAVDRMVAPDFEGEVAYGVPCDMIWPHTPTVLSRFDAAFPRARMRFVSGPSHKLRAEMDAGRLDVILTTEAEPGPEAEVLAELPLRWFGAIGGRAWQRRPLPVAVCRSCAFRPGTVAALEEAGIEWRTAVETETDLGTLAMTAADLAVMALLPGTYTGQVEEIRHDGQLPDLPSFLVNLYVAQSTANAALAKAFARLVRDAYAA